MSKEILTLVDALASEKNVDRETVFSALEFALATAAKKRFEQDHIEVRTEINRESGEYQNYRRWLIVKDEDYTYPDTEMTEEEIEEKFPGMHLDAGEYYEEKIENVEFGPLFVQSYFFPANARDDSPHIRSSLNPHNFHFSRTIGS